MSVLKDVSIETIRRMPESATVEDIVYEIIIVGNVLEDLKASEEGKSVTARELLRFIIPEEEISDEERQEIHMIRDEMKRGEKFRLDDVLDELNV